MSKNLNAKLIETRSSKKVWSLIALFLLLTVIIPFAVESASAHSPPWYVISYGYLTVQPQPVGVGEPMSVSMWVDYPFTGATLLNNIRRTNYQLTITAPDGTNTTDNWPIINDPTGINSLLFTPTQPGTYTFTFYYPGQTYLWNSTNTPGLPASSAVYYGDVFSSATATIKATVQQTQAPKPIDSYPLPTAYWTYPIEGQNTYWYTVASNWLGTPYIIGASPGTHSAGMLQPDGTAPTSAHVMWTTPIQYGGVVGGSNTAVPGAMYYTGNSYNVRFTNPLIMQGTLFFQKPYGNAGSGGDYVALDLKTGRQLWAVNTSATGVNLVPSFGYIYDYESPNQYGALPNGLLVATYNAPGLGTVWRAYDPATGILTNMNVTNVPSGARAAGAQGEYLIYTLTNYGNATNPNWYLAQWNSSRVFGAGDPAVTTAALNWYSGTENASLPQYYDWNVSISLGGSTPGWVIGTFAGGANNTYLVDPGNMALMIQGSFGMHADMSATITASMTFDPSNITAISLKPQSLGQTLWSKSYPVAPGNVTRTLVGWDPNTGIFMFEDKETFAHWGYSLSTGNYVWGPTTTLPTPEDSWNYLGLDNDYVYQGNLYYDSGYNGVMYAYNDSTGALQYTWGNGGEGNTTYAGLYTAFGIYPVWVSTMAGGILYLQGDVHSPNSPLWKGQQMYAIDAATGKQLWSIFNYAQNMYGGIAPAASGYLVAFNAYDSQLYCYGQGPSATTVTAPDIASPLGTPVVIKGTVTDVSAGTQQPEQKADFPNGVPAVSDASQSSWMEYVYMQKPKPDDVTGVSVKLTAIDPNNNSQNIGTAISDDLGNFAIAWTPPVPGLYKITATFTGSNSYYGSQAGTSFYVTAAPSAQPVQAASPPAAPTSSPVGTQSLPTTTANPAPVPTSNLTVETDIAVATAIIIIAVVVGAFVLQRRRK